MLPPALVHTSDHVCQDFVHTSLGGSDLFLEQKGQICVERQCTHSTANMVRGSFIKLDSLQLLTES